MWGIIPFVTSIVWRLHRGEIQLHGIVTYNLYERHHGPILYNAPSIQQILIAFGSGFYTEIAGELMNATHDYRFTSMTNKDVLRRTFLLQLTLLSNQMGG